MYEKNPLCKPYTNNNYQLIQLIYKVYKKIKSLCVLCKGHKKSVKILKKTLPTIELLFLALIQCCSGQQTIITKKV